jgi:hypothetical protein
MQMGTWSSLEPRDLRGGGEGHVRDACQLAVVSGLLGEEDSLEMVGRQVSVRIPHLVQHGLGLWLARLVRA